jgi:hypothetical protein
MSVNLNKEKCLALLEKVKNQNYSVFDYDILEFEIEELYRCWNNQKSTIKSLDEKILELKTKLKMK